MTARPGAREVRAGVSRAARHRLGLLVAAVALAACAIAARLYVVQVLRADELRARAAGQHETMVRLQGHRGAILDRKGRELAGSEEGFSLWARPARVRDRARAARLISPVIGTPESVLRRRLASDSPFVFVKRRLDRETSRRIAALTPVLGEGAFGFDPEARRVYPRGPLAAHVVGHYGFVGDGMAGVEGIERSYEEVLRGESTDYVAERDAQGGRVLHLLRSPQRRPGDVVLTIDMVLQHVVERELDRAVKETRAEAATAILLDPRTGQVLALANRPTADPNAPGGTGPDARRNRAITDQYEPGSTFKVITAASALDRGTVSADQLFDCQRGTIVIAGHAIRDVHPYGLLTLRGVLEHSSNVGIIKVGRTLPAEALYEAIAGFGFGRKTGIELPSEQRGRLNPVRAWSALSAPSLSMGYEIGVTPLQVAAAVAALANDGVMVPPRVVLGIRDADGSLRREPPPEPRRVVSEGTARLMGAILEGVLVRGTGKLASVPGYRLAGKTGTARKVIPGQGYSPTQRIASFVGYGPVRSPRLAAVVILDTPRGEYYGGQVAAPVFGRILADALAYLRVPPDEDPLTVEPAPEGLAATAASVVRRIPSRERTTRPETPEEPFQRIPTVEGQVPDVRGLSLRDAVATLAARGCTARVLGSGRVGTQEPAPGTPAVPGLVCTLRPGDPREAETPDGEPAAPARRGRG